MVQKYELDVWRALQSCEDCVKVRWKLALRGARGIHILVKIV